MLTNILYTSAQHMLPDTLYAANTTEISFDGKLDDEALQQSNKISSFTQRELQFGEPSTEKTAVAIVYDKQALYIGVWCYQKDAKQI